LRDSLRINNWLTFVSIIIISVTLVLYSKYIAPKQQKKAAMNSEIPCQKESTQLGKIVCFDKVYDSKMIKEGLGLLQKGDYSINGGLILSEYMPTKLEKYISLNHTDKYFLDAIDIKVNEESIRKLNINYEIIENDKANPNKKSNSKSCKLYTGYILTSFRINNKQLYRIQIDFHSYDKAEIKKRIECTIESFIHNAKI
jgi:hypothetical protein